MDRLTASIIALITAILAIAASIAYYFGIIFLVRLVVGLAFLSLTILFAIIFGVLIYAKSKYSILALLGLLTSSYAVYECYVWNNPLNIAYIIGLYIIAAILGLWWISEPDLSFSERLRTAKSLENSKNYRAAARKYEKAAELYEMLAKQKNESYYWKEAYEFWKKAENKRKAAECLERYAEDEPWYWEDVAKLWKSIDKEKARNALQKTLEYYLKEAEEEGVFWEDVAKTYEELGEKEKAKEASIQKILGVLLERSRRRQSMVEACK